MSMRRTAREYAMQFANAKEAVKVFEKQRMDIDNLISAERVKMDEASKELVKCVGSNIRNKIFPVDNGLVVLVQFESGVTVLEPERD